MSSSWLSILSHGLPESSLDAVGLVVLADISTSARRLAFAGSPSILDALVICPGFHRQQEAAKLADGEHPACTSMTTGYVFRVENDATVLYMQRMGRTGELTCLSVSDPDDRDAASTLSSNAPQTLYSAAAALTVATTGALFALSDPWALAYLTVLALARLLHVTVLHRRVTAGWKGQREPGAKSDLLVLLRQDRWIRLRGPTDAVKAVTAGGWPRAPEPSEDLAVTAATVLVYLTAGLATNASSPGKALLLLLMFATALMVELANGCTDELRLHGKVVRRHGKRNRYERRMQMAEDLVKEVGRDDWCEKMGMVLSSRKEKTGSKQSGPVVV